MNRPLLVAGLAVLSIASPVRRTEPPMLFSVAAAEAEGRTFPRATPPERPRSAFKTSPSGTAERTCVSTSGASRSRTRAGDFIVGGQIDGFTSGRASKVWWAPMHDPMERRDTLLVRAARIGNTMDTVRFTSADYGYPVIGSTSDAFYPGLLRLSKAGVWLLVATSGSDWGCLIVNVVK